MCSCSASSAGFARARGFVQAAVLALALGGCAGGAGSAARGDEGAVKAAAPDVHGTGRLYASLCASCHGADGRARTPLAGDLSPHPRDFSRCTFKYRQTPSGSLPTDHDLLRTVAVGLPGSAMPGFGALLPRGPLLALVARVKARCATFAEEQPDPPLAIPDPPRYSAASVRRGAALYRAQGCAACHGARGDGRGPAAGALKDNLGRPVRPRDYTRGVFRGGFGRRAVYRAFSTGLDGTPMPALPPGVDSAARWDLTHYLVSLSAERSRLRRYLESTPDWTEPALTWRRPWR